MDGRPVVIFTDLRFADIVVGCWACFFVVPGRWRPGVVAVWGTAFYWLYGGAFFAPVLAFVAVAYLLLLGRATLVLVGLIVVLLARFKIGAAVFAPAAAVPVTPLMPLGFSFLAFELLHVAIDVRHGKIGRPRLDEFLAYALFFPCRVAGPIRRYPAFVASMTTAEPSIVNVHAGVVRVLIGLIKKVVLADIAGLTAAEVLYADTPLHVWTAVVAYGVQLYFDFSAYSDIAIGISTMFGIEVPENFNWPYLSANIQEFWSRWHITLSTWVRDYVFTPTGRALFKTSLRRWPMLVGIASYLAAFVVIGGWHGVAANYLVWGVYHGVLTSGYLVYRRNLPTRIVESRAFQSRFVAAAGMVVTFTFVTIGWVPFMTDLPRAARLLHLMLGGR